jgi:L-ectoine synthase
MIVRKLKELLGTDKDVGGKELGWSSRRLLLKSDGMGFSLHDTLIYPDHPLHLHYQHHLEAVYCIEGRAKITDLASGKVHDLEPGTVYALDQHDKHVLEAEVLSRFVCVFNPPVVGDEVHNEDGAYPAPQD